MSVRKVLPALILIICCAANAFAASALLSEQLVNYYNEGLRAQDKGKFDEADTSYKKALLLGESPNRKFILNNMGVLYVKKGIIPQAKQFFDEAVNIDPDYKSARLNLGLLYDLLPDKLFAMEYWAKEFKMDDLKPKDYSFIAYDKQDPLDAGYQKSIFNSLAVIYAKQDDPRKAEEFFKEALKLDEQDRRIKLNLGLVYEKRYGKAKHLPYWFDLLNMASLKPAEFILEGEKKSIPY